MRSPRVRKAVSRSRCCSVSAESSSSSKISASGKNEIVVPVSPFSTSPTTARSALGTPRVNSCRYSLPPRRTSATSHSERAFTTETPTPCNPPETLYGEPSAPNLPPACSFVKTTVSAEVPWSSIWSTGMPEPLSRTVTELSGWSVTSILSLRPARASSTLLSTTSYTRWWSPRGPVEPMYMPGRRRTGSRPSSTVMSLAV